MFALHLRQLYRTCDKVIVRNVRSRRLEPAKPNPGLDRQIKVFEKDGIRLKEEEAQEVLEESESDFYNVGEAYNAHVNETLIGKYELRHQIVKEKYFKENMPNLLTWSEKEQIRHLANTEPDEWTPEKLAESFPVTVPVVKKLLKFAWKPATEQRIARHDATVMRNWKELKEGSLDIPPELRKQFLKFSNRTIPPLKKESIKIDLTQNEQLGEFEQIVRKCAVKEETNQSKSNENIANSLSLLSAEEATPKEKSKKGAKKDSKVMTLDELTHRIKKRLDEGSNVDMNDKIIINSVSTVKSETKLQKDIYVRNEVEVLQDTNDNNQLVEFKKTDAKPSEVMNYPERIRIPKKAYKKNATYKVNDCFYDHDGKFLYRVLGMSQ